MLHYVFVMYGRACWICFGTDAYMFHMFFTTLSQCSDDFFTSLLCPVDFRPIISLSSTLWITKLQTKMNNCTSLSTALTSKCIFDNWTSLVYAKRDNPTCKICEKLFQKWCECTNFFVNSLHIKRAFFSDSYQHTEICITLWVSEIKNTMMICGPFL